MREAGSAANHVPVAVLEVAAILTGVGLVCFHGFGFDAGSMDWSSPMSVLQSYFWNGIKIIALALCCAFVLVIPVAWVNYLVTGIRKGFQQLRTWLARVGNEGLKPSIATALPWIAGGTIAVGTVWLTGGPRALPFWFGALFCLALSALIACYPAVGAVSLMRLPLSLVTRLVRLSNSAGLKVLWERVEVGIVIALGLAVEAIAYVWLSDFDSTAPVRLPLGNRAWGSFVIFLAVTGLGFLVSIPVRRFRCAHLVGQPTPAVLPAPHPLVLPSARVPVLNSPIVEEPGEEFWSPTPAIAWRTWTWTGSQLRGVWEEWPTDTHIAKCDTCPEPPGWNHTCGIYAFKDSVRSMAGISWPIGIIGRVELSGLVIEHERGYRAAQARIVELWVSGPPDMVDRVRTRYPGVIVHRTEPEGR
jgi:hypothetical protein